MGKIFVPGDRSTKQPAKCICRNPECRERSDQDFEFESPNADIVCPKCGANQSPMVSLVALIHFLHRDNNGPIYGVGGLRYAFACSPTRAHLATDTNQEAATGVFAVANCPGCIKAAIERKLAPINGWQLDTPKFEEKV